ncbi:MAG: antibiotic biosynthesis monooxygenase, partial [Rhizobiales bacterium 17-65-6]
MFAVIFEVRPRPDQWEAYLALAQELRPRLIEMDGFLSVERFSARRTPGLLLSFSL